MLTNSEILINGLSEWGIRLSELQLWQFNVFHDLLIEWNSKFNLTAITEEKDIILKHYIDSLACCRAVTLNQQSIIDIGTGAGFPGIPLKIVFKDIKMAFIDSSRKKIDFIEMVLGKLGISGCETIADNIEKYAKQDINRDKYDIAITRAVSDLRCLIEYAIPVIKLHGVLIAYKGPNCEKEVDNSSNALHELRAEIRNTLDIELPFNSGSRKMIVVEKTGSTEKKYPRNVGIPKKRPL